MVETWYKKKENEGGGEKRRKCESGKRERVKMVGRKRKEGNEERVETWY